MKKNNMKKYKKPMMEIIIFGNVEIVVTSTLEEQEYQDITNDVGSWNDWYQ